MELYDIPLTITCDLGKNTVSPQVISINQNEANVKKLRVEFVSGGKPWEIPAGFSCNILMKKADGFGVDNPAESISGNTALFNITPQMSVAVGENLFQIQVIAGESDVRSFVATLSVQRAALSNNEIISDSELEAVEEIIREQVDTWLDEHPEATTTVLDGSLQEVKFAADLRKRKGSTYDTLSDLKADTSLISGMTCITNGYYAVNDGGGAQYFITDTADADRWQELLENGLYAELITDNTINVLQIGCKNDDTQDCSGILNLATQKYALFFPVGTYRFDSPLNAVNSLFGELKTGGATEFEVIKKLFPVLHANFDGEDNTVGLITIAEDCNDITIQNLNLYLDRHKCSGVSCKISKAKYHTIQNLFVNSVYDGYALYWSPTVLTSKPIEVTNLYVIGTNIIEGANTGGIYLNNCADCRFSMITIMAIRQGITQYGHMSFWQNVHIWGGVLSGYADDNYWNSCRNIALRNNAHFYGTNIYCDTAQVVITATGGKNNKVYIDNFVYWYDGRSGNTATNKNGSLLYEAPDTACYVYLIGGTISGDGNLENIVTPNNIKLKNVEIRTDKNLTIDTWGSFPFMPRCEIDVQYLQLQTEIDSTKWVEAAKLVALTAGVSVFRISLFNAIVEISVFIDESFDLTINLKYIAGENWKLYYKYTNRILTIYVEENADSVFAITPTIISRGVTLLLYKDIVNSKNELYQREILSDSKGLTLIPQSK